jgi:6-phosphogluconolactonase
VTCLGDDMILQYRFDERTGELTPNEPPAVTTQPGAGPRHFVFHPNRRFVFVVNELNGTVDTYRLAADGTLALVQTVSVLPSDFSGEPWAADIHLTPDGRFLYTSERTSSTLAAFGVDGNSGELTALGHYVTEAQPRGFNIDPASAYVVVAGEESDGLSVYAIDRQTGALDKTAEASAGDGPNWVEIIALPR